MKHIAVIRINHIKRIDDHHKSLVKSIFEYFRGCKGF